MPDATGSMTRPGSFPMAGTAPPNSRFPAGRRETATDRRGRRITLPAAAGTGERTQRRRLSRFHGPPRYRPLRGEERPRIRGAFATAQGAETLHPVSTGAIASGWYGRIPLRPNLRPRELIRDAGECVPTVLTKDSRMRPVSALAPFSACKCARTEYSGT